MNLKEKQFIIGNNIVKYLIDEDGQTSMLLIPVECADMVKEQWNMPWDKFIPRAKYMHRWEIGSIAYAHICGEFIERPGVTMKRNYGFVFFDQEYSKSNSEERITTILQNGRGHKLIHSLSHINDSDGFIISTEFVNESDNDVEIDMLSSFALENLSPFQMDDGPNKYVFHRFLGGWSMEGRLLSQSIEQLNLERTWAGFSSSNERFGSIGSFPTGKYFPSAVFEDRDAGVCWAVSLACNSTWQMELTRISNTLSFSGGVGDREFCGWRKKIKSGESFSAPKAYISAIKGNINEACNSIINVQRQTDSCPASVDGQLPIVFNEYCTTWGKPTQEKMLSYCDILKRLGVKYAVIDAGWCNAGQEQSGNGEWNIDKTIFPDIKAMTSKMREMGIIPGIWFELEVTTEGSKMFKPEYDYMKLKLDENVIKTRNIRSFWDLRRKDVREYLHEKVTKFLKENGFGYIKVDYNGNIGIGTDGEDSPAEGLRQHLECVRTFFEEMKSEIPELVVENCASGGHRLEPSMMGITDISSFSDAHEAIEIPYIAANLHNLMQPSKELIWAVIHSDDNEERLVYSLAATFLGRVCLSGEIDKLTMEQEDIIMKALAFYEKLSDVINFGVTQIYGNRSIAMRNANGLQIVARSTENQMLVVYHGFENSDGEYKLPIPSGFEICDEFYNNCAKLLGDKLTIKGVKPFTAGAILLKKSIV